MHIRAALFSVDLVLVSQASFNKIRLLVTVWLTMLPCSSPQTYRYELRYALDFCLAVFHICVFSSYWLSVYVWFKVCWLMRVVDWAEPYCNPCTAATFLAVPCQTVQDEKLRV